MSESSKSAVALVEAPPNKELIEALEEILAQARTGELQGCVMACSFRGNYVGSWWSGINANRIRLIGELEQVKWQMCSLEPLE